MREIGHLRDGRSVLIPREALDVGSGFQPRLSRFLASWKARLVISV
jgi:hypothetical protein